jgi:AraC-like DNA-binding protein
MRATICLKPGLFIFYGKYLDAETHAHHAIQITWPHAESRCGIEGQSIGEGIILAPDVAHRLSMEAGWVLLIEPQSHLGSLIQRKLDGHNYSILNLPGVDPELPLAKSQADELIFVHNAIQPLATFLDAEQAFFNLIFDDQAMIDASMDVRIKALLDALDECFAGVCIKPDAWRAAEVAESLTLSESRFLHLFREKMGMAWRPFLLWRRLMCAVQALSKGNNATEAAYIAGFSDSAHLTRTFKSLLGMNIRKARALFADTTGPVKRLP